MIAYEIKLSIDNGLTGNVVLEVKTTALAMHYEQDLGSVRLGLPLPDGCPSFTS